jgi:hypothetical protein
VSPVSPAAARGLTGHFSSHLRFGKNVAVRRFVTVAGLLALLAATLPAAGETTTSLSFTVRITQGITFRHPHPPEGDAGDVFSTTLTLFATDEQFGKPKNAKLGTMTFTWDFRGACSSTGAGCKGTSDMDTITKLPGGTITADGKDVPLSHLPFLVPIQKGTGRFAGATGSIAIAPAGHAESIYKITLP